MFKAGNRARLDLNADQVLVRLPIWVAMSLLIIGGCNQAATGGRASAPPAQAASAQSASGSSDCKVDSAKICADAQSTGTLEQGPPMGYGGQSTVATARVAIPNGPTVQAMCYYDPQHKSLSRSDWNASSALDANAAAFLKSKGFCATP